MANRLTITSPRIRTVICTRPILSAPERLRRGFFACAFQRTATRWCIDGGDTLQGSPLTYYCHAKGHSDALRRRDERSGLRLCDAWQPRLQLRLRNARGPSDQASTPHACARTCGTIAGRLPILPYAVHTLENGLRVGLVGIVTNWINVWERPENLDALHRERSPAGRAGAPWKR